MTGSARFAVIPAAYVYLFDGDRVLLQLRQNTGYMDGHWVAGAAGHIERHETAVDCAVRESAEEIGIRLDPAWLQPLTVMQRTDGTDDPIEQRVDWFFGARRWQGSPVIQEPAKCAALSWHDLDALPTPMSPYERLILEGWRDGVLDPVTAYGFS